MVPHEYRGMGVCMVPRNCVLLYFDHVLMVHYVCTFRASWLWHYFLPWGHYQNKGHVKWEWNTWPISVMLSLIRVRVIWFKNWCNFERLMQGFYVFFWLKLIVKTKYVLSSRGERNNYALYNIPSNFNTTKKFLRAFYEFL
jgi:hypothetical protein